MELETTLRDYLWTAISENYENGLYTGAISDAIFLLCRTLREKSGLELDGVALIGSSLGGKDPPIKITKLQTQSEKDEQAGFEQLGRGLIQAIRNPRSHEKKNDIREDANAIVSFIDYFLRKIESATVPFDTASFIQRVFDEDFVYSERYATLLADDIPPNKLTDVLYSVYEQKEKGKPANVGLFLATLMNRLSDEERKAFIRAVSNEMRGTTSQAAIRAIVSTFHGKHWGVLEEAARLRIENKMINAVSEGKYNDSSGSYVAGALGTWITTIGDGLLLKDKLLNVLTTKLRSTEAQEQDYVFKQFSELLLEAPSPFLIRVIKNGLKKGDRRFYDLVTFAVTFEQSSWTSQIKEDYDGFTEKKPDRDLFEDDIPF